MRKIILLCAGGMSTSVLVERMKKAAADMNYECEIAAYSSSAAREKATDADIILLGPQIRFSKGKVEEACPGVPVEVIDMKLYGRMDGKGAIELAKNKLGD